MAQSETIEKYTDAFVSSLEKLQKSNKQLTNSVIAKKLGISVSAISNYKHRRNNIKKSILQIYVNEFSVTDIEGFAPAAPPTPDNTVQEQLAEYSQSPQPSQSATKKASRTKTAGISDFPPELINLLKSMSDKLEMIVTNLNALTTSNTAMTDSLHKIQEELNTANQKKL